MKPTIIIALTAALVLLVACQNDDLTTQDQESIAEAFVLGSPTYVYDGSELQLTGTQQGPCEGCTTYTYTFTSSSAGYGDRSEQMSAQVITPHTAVIVMRTNEVVTAVLDNQWNMRTQRMIGGGTSQEPIPCPEDAMICPDGTVLVREGPDCQFPTCPTQGTATMCVDSQRNVACTKQYEPVCALLEDGTTVTKGNACDACSDQEVVMHLPGACEQDAQDQDEELFQEYYCTDEQRGAVACTMDYTPVCGYFNNGETSTQGNACAACANEEIEYYIMGEC
jgi:hypothetical protein